MIHFLFVLDWFYFSVQLQGTESLLSVYLCSLMDPMFLDEGLIHLVIMRDRRSTVKSTDPQHEAFVLIMILFTRAVKWQSENSPLVDCFNGVSSI